MFTRRRKYQCALSDESANVLNVTVSVDALGVVNRAAAVSSTLAAAMEVSVLWLLLFAACLAVAQRITEKDIVEVNNGIEVPFGRSVYIHPYRDLKIRVADGDRCIVKVIQNDPLSQIPGRLTPHHFPCQFEQHEVQYTHFGARSPLQDKVKLLIRYDSVDDTYIIPLVINVQVSSEQLEIVTKHMPLDVNRLGDISTPIDKNILQFTYDKTYQRCKVTILSSASGLPRYGEVINYANSGMMEDCDTFLKSDIRYKHTYLYNSPNQDFLPLVTELTDLEGNVLKQEYFQMMVRIKEGKDNTPPSISFSSLLIANVNQFVMTAITPPILSAEDEETPPDKLIFNITSLLGYGDGAIVSTDDQNLPITSFYQKDVEDLKIAYIPPASDSNVERNVRVELEVIDSENLASEEPRVSLIFIVKPMNTLAPLATRNTGLVLFEGQSRRLQSSKNLQIADEDNIDHVTIEVLYGLRHGKLLLAGSPVKRFAPADLDAGRVVYQHDGSDTSSDNIIFQLDDGKHKVEFLFPVTIYPEDDEPPTLIVNKGLTIMKGEEVEITDQELRAVDVDSADYMITYELLEEPSEGQIIMKQYEIPDDPDNWSFINGVYEKVVRSWTQKDLEERKIVYRHTGQHHTEPVVDVIRFRIYDQNVPPNKSDNQEFIIRIIPIDDIPPELQYGELHMVVHEFELTDITKKQMKYNDLDTNDRNLIIHITRRPYDSDAANPMDPGRIVYTDDPSTEIDSFSQAEVNHHKIAYKPPSMELGIVPRDIQFEFEVIDNSGNILPGQKFTIHLVPVDNKPPVITNTGFYVYERGYFVINPKVLDATDEDTNPDMIRFTLKKLPKYGTVKLGALELSVGDTFTKFDIANGLISYVNSGAEMDKDEIVLEATDGVHKVPVVIHIHIRPVDDEAPQLQIAPGTVGVKIKVKEGGRIAITNDVLKASDPDTDDQMITFIIDEFPRHGNIEVNGIVVNKFKQMDIQNGKVYYVHNGDEIGRKPISDSFNLTISDMSDVLIVGGNRIDHIHVVIDIEPVDNIPPAVTLGPLFSVFEGNKSTITLAYLNATDRDTEYDEIVCTIVVQPTHGYVENISPGPGSEVSRIGIPITAFAITDIKYSYINYVQSIHKKIEPIEDRFVFNCSDGTNFSPSLQFPISINPTNDEAPEMYMREFIVGEGEHLVIDLPILNAIDQDIPKDKLIFKVKTKPKHGKIVSKHGNNLEVETFTLDQIRVASSIAYYHDNSETTEDEFELELTDGVHNTSKKFIVMVIPKDDETPRLTINDGLEIGMGESKIITNYMLKAEDIDSDDDNITFIIRQAPRYGNLVYYDHNFNIPLFNYTNGMNFTQADIDSNSIMYIHTGQEGTRDLIKFDITDGTNPFIDRYFWITVEGIDLLYPDVINKGVELPEGGKVILTTDILSTNDINSDDEYLEFVITRAPLRGHLENSDRPGLPITSFTQLDLAGNKISYVHTSEDETKMDSFEFEVTDGFNSVFRTFRISISDLDNKRPIVYINRLRVKEGGVRLITPFELKVEDRDTKDENLEIVIVRLPLHGKILYDRKQTVKSFKMSDLNENHITYHHDGSETIEDSLIFIVTDGTHVDFFVHPLLDKETRKPVKLDIDIIPVDNIIPQLSANKGVTSIGPLDNGQVGFQFTNKILRAEDKDSSDINLMYIITTPPEHGIIINEAVGTDSVSTFTQADIDDMNVYYILNENVTVTHDVFHFKVVDEGENELANQQFKINWSWISLEHDNYFVNETEKHLKINLKRRGYLGETSFVGLKLKNLTAKHGLDFGGHYAKQVQFNPGQTEARWKIKIFEDDLYEKGEQFIISLEDPVMSFLEYPDEAVVTIVDEEDVSSVAIPEKTYRIKEDFGELFIPIERKGDVSEEMVVICSTQSGTATGTSSNNILSYSDYISRPQDHTSIIRFNKGETVKHCRVVIIDDSLYEEDESFIVKLTTPIGGKIGRFHKTEIVIESDDNDVPSFYFGEPEYAVDESDGYVEVTVWRTGTDLTKPASVTVQSRPSDPVSAEAGVDYIGIGRSLDFAPGVKLQTFRVVILDDLGQPVLEGSESFELVLRMPMNAILGDPDNTVITINDSLSDLPRMQFKLPSYLGFENDKQVTGFITRQGDTTHMSAVRCYTRQDSAEVAIDFEERPDTNDSFVVFVPGEIEQRCTVKLIDDHIFEPDEEFRLVLGTPVSDTAGGAIIGAQNVTHITIKDDGDKSVIKFNKTRISVKEPQRSDDISIVHIPVIRTGDLSKTSIVRVHTKDGSAKSGTDYLPLSKELHFGPNVSEIMVDVEVLYDGEKEHREAFTVHLRPDKNMLAEIKDTKAIIYIQEMNIVADVTFPTHPVVVSLRDYNNVAQARKHPTPGYPVICITACNPKHPEFTKTQILCKKEGINDSMTEFRWRVAAPSGQDGVTNDLKDVESTTFFTSTHYITLDSIYFAPGSRIQCAARAVNVDGDPGLELDSDTITVSSSDGLCTPRLEGSFGAEPFTARMRYTGPNDKEYPNLIKLSIIIPHWDGMLPVISTKPLSNFELTLSPDGLRVGHHKCSNLLDFDEIQTKYGFITNGTKNPNVVGEVEPYQYSGDLRSEPSLRFYRNLDLEACMWEFTSYFDMSELVTLCGGTISTDGQVLNLIQSYVSVRVPLYVSYIFHSPVATGGWQHNDLSSHLRLTFVYDTAILWKHGIGAPEESQLQGYLYPTGMTIGEDGRLIVNFRTEPRFRGRFILIHPGTGYESSIVAPDHPDLTFTLQLVYSEPSYAQPIQEWQFISDYAVRDYSGIYKVKLIPCTVTDDVEYSEPLQCHPREPLIFDVHIRFQQVSDPVPAEFSLNTQFHLMRKRELWLSNGSMGFGEDVDASFVPGDTIYGRIMVDPIQNLGDSFFMTIEKCFLCTGVDGYVPKYEPVNLEYGCVADSPNLLHTFKIIDKGAPHMITRTFKSIPFNATLSSDDPSADVDSLRKQPGADGFHFNSAPLFQVSYGRQWFVHCIYTVRSKANSARGIGKRSIYNHVIQDTSLLLHRNKRELEDAEDVGTNGKGTNMHRIILDFNGKLKREDSIDIKGNYEIGVNSNINKGNLIPIILGILGSVLVITLIAVSVYFAKRKKKIESTVPTTNAVTVATGNGQSRVICSQYGSRHVGDNTEV